MSSIVLQPGVKDMLLADCKDFLASEDWYVLILSCIFLIIDTPVSLQVRREGYVIISEDTYKR